MKRTLSPEYNARGVRVGNREYVFFDTEEDVPTVYLITDPGMVNVSFSEGERTEEFTSPVRVSRFTSPVGAKRVKTRLDRLSREYATRIDKMLERQRIAFEYCTENGDFLRAEEIITDVESALKRGPYPVPMWLYPLLSITPDEMRESLPSVLTKAPNHYLSDAERFADDGIPDLVGSCLDKAHKCAEMAGMADMVTDIDRKRPSMLSHAEKVAEQRRKELHDRRYPYDGLTYEEWCGLHS